MSELTLGVRRTGEQRVVDLAELVLARVEHLERVVAAEPLAVQPRERLAEARWFMGAVVAAVCSLPTIPPAERARRALERIVEDGPRPRPMAAQESLTDARCKVGA